MYEDNGQCSIFVVIHDVIVKLFDILGEHELISVFEEETKTFENNDIQCQVSYILDIFLFKFYIL